MEKNCWEVLKCERQKGGKKVEEFGVCCAYPDNGRNCWMIAGTLCEGQTDGSFAQRLGNCRKCEFYQKVMMGEI